jgi:predicted membrane protein (TIGR00267 family)
VQKKKIKRELDKAMVRTHESYQDTEANGDEIQKAMIMEVDYDNSPYLKKKKNRKIKLRFKKITTVHEKAERFAEIIISLTNGFSPFLGGIIAIFPFFFVKEAAINYFFTSFLIIFVCLIFLGIFLGFISEESKLKNVVQMLGAFILTIVIILIFLS